MKRLLLLLLFFVLTKFVNSQIYTPQNAPGYQYKYIKTDSGFALPFRDTAVGRGTTRPGSLVIRPADSLLYIYNGFKWDLVGGDVSSLVGLISSKVDSVTVASDTLKYWVNGVWYGYIMPIGVTVDTLPLHNQVIDKINLVERSNDSVFYWKQGVKYFAFKDSVGAGGGGSTDTLSLSNRIDQRATFTQVKDTMQKVLDYLSLATVNDIATFSSYARTITVRDTIRGGTFDLYTGTDPADNGMIFTDALGRKWIRQTQDGWINLLWYGARAANAYNDYANSIRPFILTALNYIAYHNEFNTLIIPFDNRYGGVYTIDSTINIKSSVAIKGTTTSQEIWFQHGRIGFTTSLLDSVRGGPNKVEIAGLNFIGGALYDPNNLDTSAHFIAPKGYTNIHDNFIQYWEGNGVHYEACTSIGSDIYGNVDFSDLWQNEINFCNNAVFTKGCDANILDIRHNSYVANRRWGTLDMGFLGISSSNNHYSLNGYDTNVVVNYNQVTYVAINTNDFININKNPEDSTTYWYAWKTGADTLVFPQWSAAKKYWSGGAFFGANDNGYSRWDFEYTEGDQPPSRTSGKNLTIGGDLGAGVTTGIVLEAVNQELFVRNGGQVIRNGKLTVNQNTGTGKINVNQDNPAEPALGLHSATLNTTEARFSNNSGQLPGQVYYEDSSFLLAPKSALSLRVDAAATKPYNNWAYDLGASTKAFLNIYSKNLIGDGVELNSLSNNFGINQTTPTAQLHIVNTATNKPGLLITGGGQDGWNSLSGEIRLGHTADYGRLGYEGSNGYVYLDNAYNNNAARIYLRTKTGGTPVNNLIAHGNGGVQLPSLPEGVAAKRVMSDAAGNLYLSDSATNTGGGTNNSIGSALKVAVGVNATDIKSIRAGYGQLADSSTTGEIKISLDSATVYDNVKTKIKDSLNANAITFEDYNVGYKILRPINSNTFRWKELIAGTNFTLDSTTTPGGIILNATGGGTNIYNTNGTLTGNRGLSGGNFNLNLYDLLNFSASSKGQNDIQSLSSTSDSTGRFTTYNYGRSSMYAYRLAQTKRSQIDVYSDSIIIQPNQNNLIVDSLSHSSVATDKMMVWDSATGKVATRLIPTGGGTVNISGTPTAGQVAEWTNATTIGGQSTIGTGSYVKNTGATISLPAINNMVGAYTNTTKAAGTTTLTSSSTYLQRLSGSTTHTVVTPDATTLTTGIGYEIRNIGAGAVTLNMNGGSLLKTIAADSVAWVTLTDNSTAAGTWDVYYSGVAGGGSMVYPGAGIAVSTGSAWGTSLTDNSANWNTAHTDRLKWDGGATDLNAATGRTSLGLGNVTNESKATMFTNPTFTQTTTVTGSMVYSGVTTPAQYTSDQNDVDPSTNYVLRVSSNSDSRKITSISGGTSGRQLLLENVGATDIVLSSDDGSSGTAANRFDFDGTDLILGPKEVRILKYDGTLSRWVAAGLEKIDAAIRRQPFFTWEYMLAGVATANFTTTAIASGTAAYTNGVTDHPGYMATTSSTTTNSGNHSYLFNLQNNLLFSGGENYECIFQPKVASNTNTTFRFGFLDATNSNDAVDGAYFEIPSGSFAVVGKTANNSTRTTSATIATIAVNTWYRAKISVNRGASSITFTLYDANGVSLGSQTNSANIPTTTGREFGAGFVVTNVGTTATLLNWLDFQSVILGAGKPINR